MFSWHTGTQIVYECVWMQYTFDGNNNMLGHNTKKSDNVD